MPCRLRIDLRRLAVEAKQDGRRRGEPERFAGQRAGEVARPGAALERARERGQVERAGRAAKVVQDRGGGGPLLDAPIDLSLPPRDRAAPRPRHAPARAGREPRGEQIPVHALGERLEPRAVRLAGVVVDQRVVLIGEERLLHPALRPQGEPRPRGGRGPEVPFRPAHEPGEQRVVQPGDEASYRRGVDVGGDERRGHLGHAIRVPAQPVPSRETLDPAQDRDRPLRRATEEVARGEHPDDLVAPHHRQVVDVGVEERRPRLVQPRVVPDHPQRLREHARHGRPRPEPLREDPVAEVAVGHDPRRIAPDEHRRDPLRPHDARGLGDGHGLLDPDGRALDEPSHLDGEIGLRRDRGAVGEARPEPVGEADREVSRERCVSEQPAELARREPVRQQILVDDDVDRRVPADERRVPE